MWDDVELEDFECPECGGEILRQDCNEIGCDDGYIDHYEEDPINLSMGEEVEKCLQCHGTGIMRWCRKCGKDIKPSILASIIA